jgi:DNA-binding MarR family transcriptional regulator
MGETLASLERAVHLIAVRLDAAVSELGITQAEAHVLAQVARRGATAIGTLHREFGHKRSTLTNVVDRLEQRGLVRRELNPSDRRSFVVHLTAAGEAAAKQVTGALDELERELAARVGERELAGVDAVVRALEAAVQPPP